MKLSCFSTAALLLAALVAAGTAAAQNPIYSPTTADCSTGAAAPENPTGPETPDGGYAGLDSDANQQLLERCSWAGFAPAGTLAPYDMTLTFNAIINVVGAVRTARVYVGINGTFQNYEGGNISVDIPAGTDLSTIVVGAQAQAANTRGCTPESICYEAEADVDVGYISIS